MDDMNTTDRTFSSIFDDDDNVYGTDPLRGDIRPKTLQAKRNAEASTRTDTPRHRRMS